MDISMFQRTLVSSSNFRLDAFSIVAYISLFSLFVSSHHSKPIDTEATKISPVSLVPENKTITHLVELQLTGNYKSPSLECSTQDDNGPLLTETRNGIISPRYRWTNFNVYPDPLYNENERVLINNAMFRLSQVLPCVRFNLYAGSPPSGDYVHIKKQSGCSSIVGRIGGVQGMSLQSPGCMSVGTIMHEMIHALGFYHEQARPDRDDFVTVFWGNIQAGREHNFLKRTYEQVSTFGVPYNPTSIMHYGPTAFSSNGLPTIQSKDGSAVGSVGKLQATDIEKLKKMYNC